MALIQWKTAVNGDWTNPADWANAVGGASGVPTAADDVEIAVVGDCTVTVDSPEAALSLTFDSLGATLLETSGSLTVGGALTIEDGVVELDSANTFAGGVSLQDGVLAIGASQALGTSSVELSGGELLATANVTLANPLLLDGGFTIAAATGVTLKLGGSTAPSFPVNPGASFEIGAPGETGVVVWSATQPATNVGNMAIDIRGGTLKAGAGSGLATLLLNDASTKVDAGATIDLAGRDATVSLLSGAGALTNSGKLATLTVTGSMTLSGVISGKLAFAANGLTVLGGDDTYTGGTTIMGYLTLGQSGSKGSVLGSIVDNGVLSINHANTFTLANAISGLGQIRQIGSGETQIDTANSYVGGTTVSAGTLAVGDGGALGSGALNLDGGAFLGTKTETIANQLQILNSVTIAAAHGVNLTLQSAAPWSVTATKLSTISFGAVGQDGTVIWTDAGGTPVFTNPNSATVDVRAGVLKATDGGVNDLTSNVSRTTIAAGATLEANGIDLTINDFEGAGVLDSATPTDITLNGASFAGSITGGLVLEALSGIVALSGTNTYSGVTLIDATGDLQLGAGGATGSIAGTSMIEDDGALSIDHSNDLTLTRQIIDGGLLSQLGTGVTTINLANTYSGGTIISAGTLALGNGDALGTGTVTMQATCSGEILATVSETLANTLDIGGKLTLAAAHGKTLTLSNSDGDIFGDGATIVFGVAGEDGTVLWASPFQTVANSGSQTIDVAAGVLKAGNTGFGALLSAAATLDVAAGATTDLNGLSVSVNAVSGSGAITDTGGAATLTAQTDSTYHGTLSGSLGLEFAAGATLTGLSNYTGDTTIDGSSVLDNRGVFDLTTDSTISGQNDPDFQNHGLFEKTGGTNFSTVEVSFENHGTIDVARGRLIFTTGFTNFGIVEGILQDVGQDVEVAADRPGETTFFGGVDNNLFKIAVAPTFIDGGAGLDTVEATANMSFGSGSLINVETIKVDNGVSVDLSHLALGERIVLASVSGGTAKVVGTQGADTIVGGAGADTIDGGAGSDWITGGRGADKFTGGAGADRFVYNAPDEGGDTIADFSHTQGDLFEISHVGFGGGLPASGQLSANRFVTGAHATQAFGQFLWNSATHTLSYDADGAGAGAAVKIATLTGVSSLSAGEIRLF